MPGAMRRSYRYFLPAFALVSSLLTFSNKLRNLQIRSEDGPIGLSLLNRAASSTQCNFPGNPDIYGLGIRAGIYLQWIASFLSSKFLDEDEVEIRDANTMFLLAIFIATAVLSTTNQEQTHAVEGLILLYIFFGGAFAVLFPVLSTKAKQLQLRSSVAGTLMRFGLLVGMATYSVWFWFYGVKGFQREECGTLIFLFGKVSMFGRAETFLKLAAITTLVIYGGLFIYLFRLVIVALYYSVVSLAGAQRIGSKVLTEEVSGQNTVNGALGIMWAYFFLDYKSSKFGREHENSKDESKRRRERLVSFILRTYVATLNRQYYSTLLFSNTNAVRSFRIKHLIVAAFAIIWSILAIELTIRWNSITGVNTIETTGQLIPFVIGTGGFCQVVYNIGKETAERSWVSRTLYISFILSSSPFLEREREDCSFERFPTVPPRLHSSPSPRRSSYSVRDSSTRPTQDSLKSMSLILSAPTRPFSLD